MIFFRIIQKGKSDMRRKAKGKAMILVEDRQRAQADVELVEKRYPIDFVLLWLHNVVAHGAPLSPIPSL